MAADTFFHPVHEQRIIALGMMGQSVRMPIVPGKHPGEWRVIQSHNIDYADEHRRPTPVHFTVGVGQCQVIFSFHVEISECGFNRRSLIGSLTEDCHRLLRGEAPVEDAYAGARYNTKTGCGFVAVPLSVWRATALRLGVSAERQDESLWHWKASTRL